MSKRVRIRSLFLPTFFVAMCALAALIVFIFSQRSDELPPGTEKSRALNEKTVGEAPAQTQSGESTSNLSVDDAGVAEQVDVPVEPRSSEARAHTSEEMSRYIDRMGSKYVNAKKYLSQADVPALIAMLDDPNQSQKWWKIETLLGFIDKEEESVDSMLAFIYRVEDWERLTAPRPGRAMLAKVDAISMLGFIGGDTATDTLILLLTEDGANQYLSAWSDDAIEASHVTRSLVRGKAAFGLIYTQEAANIQLVEELYDFILPHVRVIHQRPGSGSYLTKWKTEEELQLCKLYAQAVSAFGARGYIENEGIEAWKSILLDIDLRDRAAGGYRVRYRKDLDE